MKEERKLFDLEPLKEHAEHRSQAELKREANPGLEGLIASDRWQDVLENE